MATPENQADLVPARRKAGAGMVLIAPSESVVQPCDPCDCHSLSMGGAPWHDGQVALVHRGELEGVTFPDGEQCEGRSDIEPLSDAELAAYESAIASGSTPTDAVRSAAPFTTPDLDAAPAPAPATPPAPPTPSDPPAEEPAV